MFIRYSLLVVFWAVSVSAAADEPSLGPVIEGYGPTYPITYRDVPLHDNAEYKAVFDIAAYSDDRTSLNHRLVSVARFLNMHARNDVPVENMHLAIVVHGAAVSNLLSHEAYLTRFGTDNPNLELLSKLHEAGVEIYVCGQSLAFGGVEASELQSSAKVALSAMTMLTSLQNDGYAFLQ
jgi:intracellular sulfur oxidation DsrE/DsrF family protein